MGVGHVSCGDKEVQVQQALLPIEHLMQQVLLRVTPLGVPEQVAQQWQVIWEIKLQFYMRILLKVRPDC